MNPLADEIAARVVDEMNADSFKRPLTIKEVKRRVSDAIDEGIHHAYKMDQV